MSEESYRILNKYEINKYVNCDWFPDDVILMKDKYLVPEKYLLEDIDKEKFYRSKLDELIQSFDFGKVHEIMKLLNWTWYNKGVPSVEDMIFAVEGLYYGIQDNILNNKYSYSATGGFVLTYNPDEDQELKLVFEAVTYSVFYGN